MWGVNKGVLSLYRGAAFEAVMENTSAQAGVIWNVSMYVHLSLKQATYVGSEVFTHTSCQNGQIERCISILFVFGSHVTLFFKVHSINLGRPQAL